MKTPSTLFVRAENPGSDELRLIGKFPFNPESSQEASPQELGTFFDPNTGALSQFYNGSLKNLLLPSGSGYIANPQATQAVNPAFLSFFNRAMAIQKALYAGPPGPRASRKRLARMRYRWSPVAR